MIPPLPPDEAERLASLRALGLLDTPPEERFDRITRIARTLFDVPIAAISLVDADRQWFKSRQGLGAEQTPREVSFCGHAILGSELFEIPDATRDERFRDNPLVAGEPNLRFYAGAPLSAPDGRRIGTLCVIDRRPRELTPAQKAALRDLAACAEREIAEPFPPEAPEPAAAADAARRHARRERGLALGFGAALVLLLTAAFVSYRAVLALVAEVRRSVSAPEVLSALDASARKVILTASVARLFGALVLAGAFLTLRGVLRERARAEDALVEARDAALRDANARRAAQEELRRLGDRLRTVLDQMDAGVILIEPNGSISLFNLAAERIHGAWRGQVEGLMRAGNHPLLRPDGKTPLPPDEDPIVRALKGETTRDVHIRLRTPFRPNGCAIVASAVPMRSPQGLVTGAVLVFREAA